MVVVCCLLCVRDYCSYCSLKRSVLLVVCCLSFVACRVWLLVVVGCCCFVVFAVVSCFFVLFGVDCLLLFVSCSLCVVGCFFLFLFVDL